MKANTTHQAHLPSTGHRRLATKALMGIRTPDLLVREDSAFHPTVSPNLSDGIDNVALQDMFRKFGNVLFCKVAMFEDGKSKGYSFVQFESEESALAATDKLNGFTVADKQFIYG
ncbi:hypothetical protein ACLB2K_062894 [Fragaria x ananassa]